MKKLNFKKNYISELIEIERNARRLVTQAIEVNKEITQFEVRARLKGQVLIGSDKFNKLRSDLVKIMSSINVVANYEGKGRDDLDVSVLIAAETVIRRISPTQSKSVRELAVKIKGAFQEFRKLLTTYEENIETVDPQLRSNEGLVKVISEFEVLWEKGNEFLVDQKKLEKLLSLSQTINILCEKYTEISEQFESRDPNIFFWIPAVLLLKAVCKEDKDICEDFLPALNDRNTSECQIFLEMSAIYRELIKEMKNEYKAYNLLERSLLLDKVPNFEQNIANLINEFLNKTKKLSISLQRNNPTEWNNFIDVAISD